jgi:hypothetical protein
MKMSTYRKKLLERRDALARELEELDQKIARLDEIRDEMKLLENGEANEDAVD